MDNQQPPGALQQTNYDTANGGHYGKLHSLLSYTAAQPLLLSTFWAISLTCQ